MQEVGVGHLVEVGLGGKELPADGQVHHKEHDHQAVDQGKGHEQLVKVVVRLDPVDKAKLNT